MTPGFKHIARNTFIIEAVERKSWFPSLEHDLHKAIMALLQMPDSFTNTTRAARQVFLLDAGL